MKKIYILTFASLLGFSSLNAQSLGTPSKGRPLKSNVDKSKYMHDAEKNRATTTFFIDYEFADQTRQDFEFGYSDWQRYIWDMNFRYDTATVTSGQLYGIVATSHTGSVTNQLNDSYGYYTGGSAVAPTYPIDIIHSSAGVTIDSVFVNCGHENNSGTNDTLEFTVISLSGTGHPGAGYTHTTLFTKKVFSGAGMGFNGSTDWLTGNVVGTSMGFTVPGGTKWGICVKYYGSTLDTFGLIAGFANTGAPCAGPPAVPFFATQSLYSTNTYRVDMQYAEYGILPTSGGADTYYDCDGVPGYTVGTDSDNTLQNWALWMKVTADVTGAVTVDNNTELITSLDQNMPNPFNGNTTINYSIAQKAPVAFTVTDLSGKVVIAENYGTQNSGQHTISLSANQLESGVYYYTVIAGGSKMSRKMVVTK
ncbi:MAG TPA: T9SS type A sorting domain-containing protein [Flavobacteriales bacterium]|nr:T9SS type A sorting domain-containing protein [Flavobacteriales bacterium]